MNFQTFLLFLCFTTAVSNKTAADSPAGIAINLATLGNDTLDVSGANVLIDYAGKPFVLDIPEACQKPETPEEQFSRVTSQRNDSIDFAQYLQLDGCSAAWRKRDFAKIDTNNDSKISADEWNAYNAEIRKSIEEAEMNMRKFTFNRLDKDSNKELSKKELEHYLRERLINSDNLTDYLMGRNLNFTQFVDFDKTVPNDTFPFDNPLPIYDYLAPMYAYDYETPTDEEVGIIEPAVIDPSFSRPAPRPAVMPAVMPAVSSGPIQIQPAVASGGVKENTMSAAVMPH